MTFLERSVAAFMESVTSFEELRQALDDLETAGAPSDACLTIDDEGTGLVSFRASWVLDAEADGEPDPVDPFAVVVNALDSLGD